MLGAHGMAHPAYADNYCEKHDVDHQEDICPLCWHEDPEICEEHNLPVPQGGKCELCEERYQDELSQRELSQDGSR